MSFPQERPRRLRRTEVLRCMVREIHLRADQLVLPVFVRPGRGLREPIPSMPGCYHLSADQLVREAREAWELGLRAMLLFGLPEHKDERGTSAYDPQGPVQRALMALKEALPDMVFFDATSIYVEGEGGKTVGQYGNSKDHRPDRKQMIVGVVLDNEGIPLCCEMWPGNVTDVTTLKEIVKRFQRCFGIKDVCIVADRDMISRKMTDFLESEKSSFSYILGVRMRK